MFAIDNGQVSPRGKLIIPTHEQLSRQPLMTQRLVLEPFRVQIAPRFFRAVDESREFLSPWLPWVPLNDSVDASRRYALSSYKDWQEGHAFRFFIRPRNKPDFIGAITLENVVKIHRSCDLGYWLHPKWTSKGLMHEAAEYLIAFAFDSMNFHRVRAAAAVENLASRRVIERLAFQQEGLARDSERVRGRWLSHVIYSKLKTDTAHHG